MKANGSSRRKERALLVFVKEPVPGAVKTRLLPEFSREEAAALSGAMVEDLLAVHGESEGHDTIVFFTPPDSMDRMRAWLGTDLTLLKQEGDNLGSRMRNAFAWAFGAGYGKVIIVGSDCLLVDKSDVDDAFNGLVESKLVIGPSEDGGYYLIGASTLETSVFEGINWGTDAVLLETMEKIAAAGISTLLLGRKYDIDCCADARRFYSDYGRGAPRHPAPRSFEVLARVFDRS